MQKWYKRYLEEVASGQLELPGYEQVSQLQLTDW